MTANIQQSLIPAEPIANKLDRVDADINRSGEDDSATNCVGCIVSESTKHKADSEEDQSNILLAIVYIKVAALVHIPSAVSESQLPSTCYVKKFSERFQMDC